MNEQDAKNLQSQIRTIKIMVMGLIALVIVSIGLTIFGLISQSNRPDPQNFQNLRNSMPNYQLRN